MKEARECRSQADAEPVNATRHLLGPPGCVCCKGRKGVSVSHPQGRVLPSLLGERRPFTGGPWRQAPRRRFSRVHSRKHRTQDREEADLDTPFVLSLTRASSALRERRQKLRGKMIPARAEDGVSALLPSLPSELLPDTFLFFRTRTTPTL